MKSTLLTLVVIAISAAGGAWHFFEDEIRGRLGLEKQIEVATKLATEAAADLATEKKEDPEFVKETNHDPIIIIQEVGETDNQRIERIVTLRYPDIDPPSFETAFPTLDQLPLEAHPEQVSVNQVVSFKRMINDTMVGASYVKAGGKVKPTTVSGDILAIASLADNQMESTIPVVQTDFVAMTKASYDQTVANAKIRIQEARDADRSDLKAKPHLLKTWKSDVDPIWESGDTGHYSAIRNSLDRLLAGRSIKAVGFFHYGSEFIEGDGLSGNYEVGIVLLKGLDHGFGPYLWRSKFFEQNGQVTWQGLPK